MAYRIPANESTSMAVVDAISEKKGVDPTELPQIGEKIDADALDTLAETEGSSIQFPFEGYEITIVDGFVSVCRA